MLEKELKAIVRKGGFTMSKDWGSRIRGWGNSSQGYSFSDVFPWRARYVRNGYRLWSYISSRTQEVSISYNGDTSMSAKGISKKERKERMDALFTYLTEQGVVCERKDDCIMVLVDNPYSEHEVKDADERWNQVTRRK